jgi:glycosyltransferase involved in cell wall biosynthesis
MELSIIVPTFNNLNYLKCFIESIKENSIYNHELVIHINEGSDGTLNYIKENNIKFTHSHENIGLCKAVNNAVKKSSNKLILYAHDDMYFCKKWDLYLEKELKNYNDKLFYISGTNVSYKDGIINFDCGASPSDFDKEKFNKFCENDNTKDLQGSHWAPHIIHKDLWNRVGGFSPEFYPGDGSDPDFCCKLWFENVRIFKILSKFKVYHFGSITTRKSNLKINNGTKIFLLKWGFNPKFFRKHYLKVNETNVYNGPLKQPSKSFSYYKDLLINKLKLVYLKKFN